MFFKKTYQKTQFIKLVDNTTIESLIGEYGWLFLAGIIGLLFQSTIQEAVDGIMVFLGNDYHEDDVVEVDGWFTWPYRKSRYVENRILYLSCRKW